MKVNKLYRLPTGNITQSLDYYLRSWKKIAKPLCKKTGWKLAAFNPDFCFIDQNNKTINLSVSAVKQLTK